MARKKKKEPKQRNWTVKHLMRKGAQKHRNRKCEDKHTHKE